MKEKLTNTHQEVSPTNVRHLVVYDILNYINQNVSQPLINSLFI